MTEKKWDLFDAYDDWIPPEAYQTIKKTCKFCGEIIIRTNNIWCHKTTKSKIFQKSCINPVPEC